MTDMEDDVLMLCVARIYTHIHASSAMGLSIIYHCLSNLHLTGERCGQRYPKLQR
jgi:hypothetical protein